MTLKASLYDQLPREELIRLLEARDNEPDNAEIYISSETPTIKRIISEVLAILFNEENKPIEKAMNLLLDYFNAEWGYARIASEENGGASWATTLCSRVPRRAPSLESAEKAGSAPACLRAEALVASMRRPPR